MNMESSDFPSGFDNWQLKVLDKGNHITPTDRAKPLVKFIAKQKGEHQCFVEHGIDRQYNCFAD